MSMTLQSTYSSAPGIAYAGQLEGSIYAADIVTMLNADVVSIPMGAPVVLSGSPATNKDVVLPANSTDQVFGIVLHDNNYARQWTDSDGNKHGDLDSTGLVVGTFMSVLRRGKVAVLCQYATTVGENLHSAYNATGAKYTAVGQVSGSAETAHSIKTTATEFLTAASAGGFAWLDCDFVASASTGD